MKKISRAKGAEVDKLQSEYIQFYIQSLRQGILLNHSYTDEMQTLKDIVKRKDAELQQLLLQLKQGESESAGDNICIYAKLITLAL